MCEICGEIRGDANVDLLATILGGPYERRVLAESHTMAVLPSVGPLVPGHVLICPIRHVNRLASAQAAEVADLVEMKSRVSDVLYSVYGLPTQFFEHGASEDGKNIPCTVSHAHLHAVPVTSLWAGLPKSLAWVSVDVAVDRIAEQVGAREYLYYEDDLGSAVVATVDRGNIESQILRRVIASQVGNASEWNWRDFPRVDSLRATWDRLGQAFGSAKAVAAPT